MHPVVIIGSGHNALTTAFYLARAGAKPLVLERRSIVGGAAVTEEFAPGFRGPTLAHATGPLRSSIVRDMGLQNVDLVRPDARLVTLTPDGRALAFSTDENRTLDSIRAFSPEDAARYPDFRQALERIAGFLGPLLEQTPPPLDAGGAGGLWDLMRIGRRFRALGRADGFRLLRWTPMAVADLVAEFFSTDAVQAAIGARGIFGTAQGPWSAGTGAVLLLTAASDPVPGGSTVLVKGGPGALTAAMADAATRAGAEIRTSAGVARVLTQDGQATGVVLEDGSRIDARAVISGADPRRTFLDLVDPIDLDPGFLTQVRNYRSRGTTAKVNLALGARPAFPAITNPADLKGRVQIGSGIDYLERAFDASKYGMISAEPYLELTVPTLHDQSLAPPGAHVMSVYVQYAPFRLAGGRAWNDARVELFDVVLRTLERYAPGISGLVRHQQVLTPQDFEQTYSLTGGHIHHGEPALDQLFTMRPLLGWARYRTPIRQLYLCGAGTHPGPGLTGGPGQNAAREILKDLRSVR
jgi:phytoene dehydrogenase-like protein